MKELNYRFGFSYFTAITPKECLSRKCSIPTPGTPTAPAIVSPTKTPLQINMPMHNEIKIDSTVQQSIKTMSSQVDDSNHDPFASAPFSLSNVFKTRSSIKNRTKRELNFN